MNNLLGSAYNALGNHEKAIQIYSKVLSNNHSQPEIFTNRGNAYEASGNKQLALQDYNTALQLDPRLYSALINRGNLLHKQGNLEDSVKDYLTSVKLKQNPINAYFGLGCVYMEKEDFRKALTYFNKIISLEPSHIDALINRAYCFRCLHDLNSALESYRQALDINPDSLISICGMAEAFSDLKDFDSALEQFKNALELNPDYPRALNGLGKIKIDMGLYVEATSILERAIELEPQFTFALTNLGTALTSTKRYGEAISVFKRAIKADHKLAEPHNNLGHVYWLSGQYSVAIDCFTEAIKRNKKYAEAYSNRGNALQSLGCLNEAVSDYEKAISLKENYTSSFSNMLTTLNYSTTVTQSFALKKAKDYGRLVTRLSKPLKSPSKVSQGHERVRVGIVSADLRNHPVGYFVESVFRELESISIYIYQNRTDKDELTDRIEPLCTSWQSIHAISDYEAAKKIRSDDIDILIDLSGHTAGNRLPLFAYKAAPIQISWLGYFATTGVPQIDYLIGDHHMNPPHLDRNFTEKVVRLKNTRWCFTPPPNAPDIESTSTEARADSTFGCFNNLTKLNDEVFELWSSIVNSTPGSLLLLKNSQFREAKNISTVHRRLLEIGIKETQLILEGPAPRHDYLKSYNQVDLALDPFPFTGGATSVEGLWMGVPFVTLEGDSMVGRQGVSILKNAGLRNSLPNPRKIMSKKQYRWHSTKKD